MIKYLCIIILLISTGCTKVGYRHIIYNKDPKEVANLYRLGIQFGFFVPKDIKWVWFGISRPMNKTPPFYIFFTDFEEGTELKLLELNITDFKTKKRVYTMPQYKVIKTTMLSVDDIYYSRSDMDDPIDFYGFRNGTQRRYFEAIKQVIYNNHLGQQPQLYFIGILLLNDIELEKKPYLVTMKVQTPNNEIFERTRKLEWGEQRKQYFLPTH